MSDGSTPEGAVAPPLPPEAIDTKVALPTTPLPGEDPLPKPIEADAEGDDGETLPDAAGETADAELVSATESEKKKSQENEFILLANNTFTRKAAEIENSLSKDPKVRAEQVKSLSPDQEAILGGQMVMALVKSGAPRNFATPDQPTGTDLTKGKPIEAQARTATGELLDVKLLKLQSFDGVNFICQAETAPGTTQPVVVSSAEMIRGQLLNTQDALTNSSLLSSAEQTVMKTYVDFLTRGDTAVPEPGTVASSELDTVIKTVAKEANIPTTDDLATFAENFGLSEEDTQALMEATTGNILEYRSFKDALLKTDFSPKELNGKIELIDKAIIALEERTSMKPEEKAAKIRALEEQKQLFSEVKKMYGGGLETFFTGLANGTLPQDQAKSFLETFRSGNISEAFQQLPGIEKLPDESDEQWKQRLKKQLGMAGLIALIIMMAAAQSIPAVGPQQGGGH